MKEPLSCYPFCPKLHSAVNLGDGSSFLPLSRHMLHPSTGSLSKIHSWAQKWLSIKFSLCPKNVSSHLSKCRAKCDEKLSELGKMCYILIRFLQLVHYIYKKSSIAFRLFATHFGQWKAPWVGHWKRVMDLFSFSSSHSRIYSDIEVIVARPKVTKRTRAHQSATTWRERGNLALEMARRVGCNKRKKKRTLALMLSVKFCEFVSINFICSRILKGHMSRARRKRRRTQFKLNVFRVQIW